MFLSRSFSRALTCAAFFIAVAGLPAMADHGPAAAGGPYRGFSSGTMLHADVMTTASARLLDVEVGVADAAVDSEGLGAVRSVYR
ncbi:MAG TPA: hypothetical protein VM600_09410, partial [Actinomycetota bacterium]|nr:hypothetical protein [Actinomycetota bacterium]